MKFFIKCERHTQTSSSNWVSITGVLICCNTWETVLGTLTVTDWPVGVLCELLAMMVCQ